ncbi:MAG TPA: glycosyltransferase family 39 protein [Candidatus Udaeobacter sp.]|nr:glycosyltransferase family 39 protein [Candidatus Udaeobacter sp.]
MFAPSDFSARPERDRRRSIAPALLLFAVAFAVRALYAWIAAGPSATPSSDAAEYDEVAWNLARGAGFSFGAGAAVHPTAFVPPLVPWITSLLYRAAGHHYFGALLLQCAIGALTPLLVQSLGAAMFSGGAGRLAGWLAAFDPLLIFFSGYLLTETTFCVALLAALVASAEWVKTPRPGRALGVGLLWGIASLTRPPALLLPFVVIGWALVPLGLTVQPRDRIRQVAMVALGLLIVVGPWTLRNAAALHAFVPVTTGAGRALLDSNNEQVWRDPARRGGASNASSLEPYASELRGRSETEVDRRARHHAFEFLGAHVRDWPMMALAKIGRLWRLNAEGGGTGSWQRAGSPLERLRRVVDPLLLWSLITLPFAVWGLVRSLQGPRRWFQALPGLVVLYFTLGAVVFWGALRMRVPIQPLALLLTAVGVEDARRRWRARGHGLRLIEGRRKAS